MAPKGTILVTGANGGLGSAIVSQIIKTPSLADEYHGLYTVRSAKSAQAVSAILARKSRPQQQQHPQHELVDLDLSSLASVRRTAGEINRRVKAGEIPPIRALILNAAWQEYTTGTRTGDGFDMAFQVNYLAHFLLTLLLLQSMDRRDGRIVVLGSWSHDVADPRNKTGPPGMAYQREGYNRSIFTSEPWNGEDVARGHWSSAADHPGNLEAGYRRYGASKLCEIMMMRELSNRIAGDPALSGVSVLALDPGAMSSGLVRRGSAMLIFFIKAFMPLMAWLSGLFAPNGMLRTTAKSADDVVRAAFSSEPPVGPRPNGVYLNGSAMGEVGAEAKDAWKCGRLWRDSLEWAQVKGGDTALVSWK